MGGNVISENPLLHLVEEQQSNGGDVSISVPDILDLYSRKARRGRQRRASSRGVSRSPPAPAIGDSWSRGGGQSPGAPCPRRSMNWARCLKNPGERVRARAAGCMCLAIT